MRKFSRGWRSTAFFLCIPTLFISAAAVSLAAAGNSKGDIRSEWWAATQRHIADSQYDVTWQEKSAQAVLPTGWQAPNRSHNFRIHFADDGVRVIPRTESRPGDPNSQATEPSWSWELRLARWGHPGAMALTVPARAKAAGNEVEYDRGTLVEKYVNDPRGFEQIFTLNEAPAGGAGSLVALDLSLSGDLSQFGYSVAAAGDVDGDGFADVIIGAPFHLNQGAAYLYRGSTSGLSAAPASTLDDSPQNRSDFGAGARLRHASFGGRRRLPGGHLLGVGRWLEPDGDGRRDTNAGSRLLLPDRGAERLSFGRGFAREQELRGSTRRSHLSVSDLVQFAEEVEALLG